MSVFVLIVFFFQAEDGIRDSSVTGVQTCALPIYVGRHALHHFRLYGDDRWSYPCDGVGDRGAARCTHRVVGCLELPGRLLGGRRGARSTLTGNENDCAERPRETNPHTSVRDLGRLARSLRNRSTPLSLSGCTTRSRSAWGGRQMMSAPASAHSAN